MKVLLIADTHVPKRARTLPDQLWRAIERADVVVHAGDWVEVALLDELESRARRVIGVWGNNDGAALRSRLPQVAYDEVGGVHLAVVHETGPASGRELRCDRDFADVDVLVFGHSHIPWDTTTPRGLRLMNPGSPTDRRRQPVGTYMTATFIDGKVRTVRLVPVRPGR